MMKKKLLSILLGLFFAASTPASAQNAPVLSTYQSTPFWLSGQTIPHVMLVMERDWKMFYPAYNNLADLSGNGILDIGFNPQVTYVGYFDANSCYTYSTSDDGKFVRAGATTSQTQTELEALVPTAIKNSNLEHPMSAHGICNAGSNNSGSNGNWHGNWLNYALTSRMDAIRKVLYGGKRETDDVDKTILEMVYIPGNAHVWGGELYADDIWEKYAPSSPWYNIPNFTGYAKPTSATMHFWARTSLYWARPLSSSNALPQPTDHYSVVESQIPLFRVINNIPSTNLHPFLKTPIRIWDWVGDHTSYGTMPSDGNMAKSKTLSGAMNGQTWMYKYNTDVARNFSARVQVCQNGNISPTEGCRAYGNNYKPTGLLQEYGESEKMFFGLLTGSLNYERNDTYRPANRANREGGTRYRGGVVRHHIQPFSNYINTTTGQIKTSGSTRTGIIATIDSFEITGLGSIGDGHAHNKVYQDGSQAGNPLGEMVWEATRYLVGTGTNPTGTGGAYTSAGGLNPSSLFLPGSETKVRNHKRALYSLPFLTTWAGRPPLAINSDGDCPKPVIMVISEVYPDHDSDFYPNASDFNKVPLLKTASPLPATFNMETYLDLITDSESLTSAKANGKYFFYPNARGLCTAKPLSTGLKEILGHCPSEPSLEGTYNIAAVTYYAHTHNFGPMAGETDLERNVDLYAVGIAGNFPDITLTVDDHRSLTLMPITLASLSVSSNYPEGKADNELKTLLNFFIEYWLTDDGHEYFDTDTNTTKIRKVPYKVKFSTNFEFTTTPCYTYKGNSNNWERDIFNTFTISLMTTASTNIAFRETTPLFINSGPYKTDRNTYLSDRNRGVYTGQTYYYAFKRPPKGTAFNIAKDKLTVAGVAIHTDTFGSGYGSGGLGGYTITGVTFPGAYVDAGLYRADYPLYYTNRSGFQPNSNNLIDEPVPLDPSGSGIPGAQWGWKSGRWHNSMHYTSNGADCYYYHPPTIQDDLLTPAECPYYGYTDTSDWSDTDMRTAYNPRPSAIQVCGIRAAGYPYPQYNSIELDAFKTSLMRYVQVRSFKFDTSANKPAKLPNPMWLAAKYGGFKDRNNNGRPDLDSEWLRGGKSIGAADPYNYFGVANMSELPTQLGNAFEAIASSVATGTANAASISAVLGGGISLQTQYRNVYQATDLATTIVWGGSVYAFLVDKWGNLRADSNKNQTLELITSPKEEDWNTLYPDRPKPNPYEPIGDMIVHLVEPAGTGLPTVYLCRDIYGDNNGGNYLPTDKHPTTTNAGYPPNSDCQQIGSLDEVPTLWNVAQKVSDMDVTARRLYAYNGTKTSDGITGWSNGVDLTRYPFKSTAGPNLNALHFYMGQADTAETADLIDYIRGTDFPAKYRQRTARLPWDTVNSAAKVWRMGDVINSRPVIVEAPSSAFHLTYGDASYSAYRSQKATRRQVAYFGSNDGILHAANIGFFGNLASGHAGYSVTPLSGITPSPNFELGEEMWGVIPTSVLPHLQWLASNAYQHSYYVDLKPQIFDVKDGNTWRTIMIVGLRLGGPPIPLENGDSTTPYTTPEFFAMDVTDPEETPTLLWRFSDPSLGQSTALPTMVRSNNGIYDKWYVILPSGPTQTDSTGQPVFTAAAQLYAGRSNQKARVIVLDALTGQYARNRDRNPGSTTTPDPLTVSEGMSFFNDTFTPRARKYGTTSGVTTWSHHIVYLGLSSTDSNNRDSGAVYRIQMAKTDGTALAPDAWTLTRLYKTDKPVTAAVNSTYDAVGNLWVLFGTGRIWGKEDMTPCGIINQAPDCVECYEQYIFGLKEPVDSFGQLTYAEIAQDTNILDVSDIKVYGNGDLMPAINNSGKSTYETLYYHMLSKTSAGTPVVQGYKWKLANWRRNSLNSTSHSDSVFELVNTQIKVDTLANGRVNGVVTTYIPSSNICEPLGESYIMVFDTFTGLPAPYMADYGEGIIVGGEITVTSSGGSATTYQEVTGLKRVGAGMASEVAIRKTDTGTRYDAIGFAGQKVGFTLPSGQSVNEGFISWREVLDMQFDLNKTGDNLFKDLL